MKNKIMSDTEKTILETQMVILQVLINYEPRDYFRESELKEQMYKILDLLQK